MNDSRLLGNVRRNGFAVAIAIFATLAAFTKSAQAQVDVNSIFSHDGSRYTYWFEVTNNSAFPIALVTAEVPLALDDVQDIGMPQGFLAVFDPGFDTFDMLEDADPFTTATFAPGSTVSGFTFTSENRIDPATFTALLDDGNFTAVTGNVSLVAVPEPGTIALYGVGLLALGGIAARRRKVAID